MVSAVPEVVVVDFHHAR